MWLGGRLYDTTGSYDVVWWLAVALGVFAALVNLPVRETAIRAARNPRPHDEDATPRVAGLGGRGASCSASRFAAYLNPHLAVTLANQLWSCF